MLDEWAQFKGWYGRERKGRSQRGVWIQVNLHRRVSLLVILWIHIIPGEKRYIQFPFSIEANWRELGCTSDLRALDQKMG